MKDVNKIKKEIQNRRKKRVRSKVSGNAGCPRLRVFRSLKHIEVQLVDDAQGKTLVSAKDRDIKSDKKNKVDVSFEVGKLVAKKAIEKKIEKVVFDRGGNKYHGRVKAVANGAREGGLVF